MKTMFLLIQSTDNVVDTLSNFGESAPQVEKLSILKLALDPSSLWIMIPLFLLLGFTFYLFIERWLVIKKAATEERNFMNNIRDFIHHGKIDSAVALCKGNESPLSRMIEKGLSRIGKPLEDISAAIENTGKLEVARLEKRVSVLATISAIAPMLGFLGTVVGMVVAFHAMEANPNNLNITQLAGGIYTAMVTTVAGLIVGIIAYVAYNLLTTKISSVVNVLETRSTEFMDLLHEPV